MRAALFACCLAAFVATAPGAFAADVGQDAAISQAQDVKALRAALQDGTTKAQNSEFAAAAQVLKAVVTSPAFTQLNGQEQYFSYYLLGLAELNSNDQHAALIMLKLATLSSYSSGGDWQLRLSAAFIIKDYDDSIDSLETIAARWPGSLTEISDSAIYLLANKAAAESDDRAIALLSALHTAKWRPQSPFQIADFLWFELARAYVNRGDTTAAVAVLADVDDAGILIRVRSDKRFDRIVLANPSHFDVNTALARAVEKVKSQAAAAPDSLEGVNNLADVLIKANRAAEALTILDRAIARAKPEVGAAASPYSDYDRQMNWTLNQRARALSAVGRQQDSLDAYARGARRPEDGNVNVSQAINLADAYYANARPKDALDAVADLNPASASGYGRMALASAQACAYVQLNDQPNLTKALDYMRAHVPDGEHPLLESLICANDLDEAAKLLIAELQDPARRTETLYFFQDFIAPPGAPPIDLENRRRLLALRERPDVAAAISAVGRVDSYPLLPPGY
jgi:hypothetical protein